MGVALRSASKISPHSQSEVRLHIIFLTDMTQLAGRRRLFTWKNSCNTRQEDRWFLLITTTSHSLHFPSLPFCLHGDLTPQHTHTHTLLVIVQIRKYEVELQSGHYHCVTQYCVFRLYILTCGNLCLQQNIVTVGQGQAFQWWVASSFLTGHSVCGS